MFIVTLLKECHILKSSSIYSNPCKADITIMDLLHYIIVLYIILLNRIIVDYFILLYYYHLFSIAFIILLQFSFLMSYQFYILSLFKFYLILCCICCFILCYCNYDHLWSLLLLFSLWDLLSQKCKIKANSFTFSEIDKNVLFFP